MIKWIDMSKVSIYLSIYWKRSQP